MNATKSVVLLMLVAGCGNPSGAKEPRVATDTIAAAPGRVEGATETFRLGTSLQAPVAKLFVKEGDTVRAGQILVELDCGDLNAEAASLTAKASAAKARHQKLVRGSRPEEIAEAAARTRAAQAEANRATAYGARVGELFKQKMMSEATLDAAERDRRSATAQLEAAQARESMLRAGPRREEIVEAAAEQQALERASDAVLRRVELCKVLSPVYGVVLKTYITEGELVAPIKGEPLVSVADLSRMRVRAELDERDVGLVFQDQQVRILTDTRPSHTIEGKVELISPSMGRRRTLSSDPAEKSDRDIQEVVIAIAEGHQLPVGLRVTVQFLGNKANAISVREPDDHRVKG